MLEFFATLGGVVLLAIGAMVPGYVEGNAERALRDGVKGAQPDVRIEADPFLQLPLGHLPRVTVALDGAEVGPLAIPDLDIEATHVRVPPGAVWGFAPPKLLAPADVKVRLGGTAAGWRASLAKLTQGGPLEDVPLPKSPLSLLTGGKADLEGFELTLAPGRLGMKLAITSKIGAKLPLTFSFAPTVSADGRRLTLGDPQVTIGDKPLPSALLGFLSAAPILDLDHVDLPGRDWKLSAVDVGPAGVWLEARGVIDELPAR